MRVGLVIYGSLDTVSGGYLYDRQLVRYLESQGDEVDIIALPWRNYARRLTDNCSADLLRRMAGDFDVLLQDELNHPSLAWANGRVARRAPIVSIVHHLRCSEARPRWQNALYRRIERRYLRSIDAFIYNSQTTRRAVEGLLGRAGNGPSRPHAVAYPGGERLAHVDLTGLLRPVRSGPLRLLFVGNLIPRKGLHVLLDALARLPDVAWRLTVVGSATSDPTYARRIGARLRRPALAGRVALRGGLPDAELAAEMAAADLLVVPSSYEGFGIVYLEGMGFGLPAVATTAGAAAEIIRDGENGFLVLPGDVAALAGRIGELADDRERLARMSAAALDRFARHPTWEQTTASIRAFLLALVNKPAPTLAQNR
jgi:glycosyltransferase involved in cell wall biosynthesis